MSGRHAGAPGDPTRTGGEPGLHLVEREQRAVGVQQVAQPGEVAVGRRDDADVHHRRLHEHPGDLARVLGQHALHRVEVAERHDHRERDHRLGDRRAGAHGVRARLGARFLERRVHGELHVVVVAVVRALDLDDLRPAGRGAHQVDRVHRRFGAGVAEPPARQPEPAGQLLGDDDRVGDRLREVRPQRDALGDRPHDDGVRVPDEHDAEAGVQVHVLGAVGVEHPRALAVGHPDGLRWCGLPARRHAADERAARLGEQLHASAASGRGSVPPRRRRARRPRRDPAGTVLVTVALHLRGSPGRSWRPTPARRLPRARTGPGCSHATRCRAGRSRTRPSPGGS